MKGSLRGIYRHRPKWVFCKFSCFTALPGGLPFSHYAICIGNVATIEFMADKVRELLGEVFHQDLILRAFWPGYGWFQAIQVELYYLRIFDFIFAGSPQHVFLTIFTNEIDLLL